MARPRLPWLRSHSFRTPKHKWRRHLGRRQGLCCELCCYFLLAAEGKVHTRDVLEVVLARGCAGDVIGAEVGIQIVHFNRTELNRLGDWDVHAHAVLHGETVVAPVARSTITL